MNGIKYPYLPAGWEIKLVEPDNQYMREAKAVCRELTTDHLQPTGAVVVWGDPPASSGSKLWRAGEIIAREANQARLKHPWIRSRHAAGWCVRKWLKIPSGQKYWLCPGCSTHHQHAESRAARAAARTGLDLSAAALYLWGHWWCCEPCWRAIIKAGIGEVYLMTGGDVLFNKSHPENKIGLFD